MSIETNSRRSFLKKAAYSAPVIIGLGTLVNPAKAKATTIIVDHVSTVEFNIQQVKDRNPFWSQEYRDNRQQWKEDEATHGHNIPPQRFFGIK